jgi:hypothetical protein
MTADEDTLICSVSRQALAKLAAGGGLEHRLLEQLLGDAGPHADSPRTTSV